MKRFILFFIFASSIIIGYSQRTAKVSATYTYYAPEIMSVEEAKRVALDRAKIQAIADEFGTIVSQSTSTVISNKNGQTDTQFFSLGGSDVKGEWIETIGEPDYDLKFDNHFLIIKCSVIGRIRETNQQNFEIEAKLLKNGLTANFESYDFRDGDSIYLQFASSYDGNISIYLLQNENVYKLLPYKRSLDQEFTVESGRDYIFFSKATEIKGSNLVDEYELYADNEIDIANILILYSPQKIGTDAFNDKLYDEPSSLDIKTFNKWLINKRNRDAYIKVKNLSLTIHKK